MADLNWGLWQWLSFGGLTISAGMAGAAAFIKFFGGKMISHQFDKRLEAFKHEQNAKLEADRAVNAQTLERMRFDIAASLDRTSKLHQFEFEVLPKVWRVAQEAVSHVYQFTKLLKQGYDIHSFTRRERIELYKKREYTDAQQEHIEESININMIEGQKALNAVEGLIVRTKAWETHQVFRNYLFDHGIFMQADIRAEFSKLDHVLFDALHEQLDDENGDLADKKTIRERRVARDALSNSWEKTRVEMEAMVQGRLWNARLPTVDQREA